MVLISEITIKRNLRDNVAIVFQKSELFNMSIKDNVLKGNHLALDDDISTALKIAQAKDFIDILPFGYDTVITQRGKNLSGGQKQRVSIARAVIKKAPIIILDDSTSALDLKTEASFYDALKEERHDVTKIMIVQRIASALRADRIIVLDNGSIEAIGTHEKLLRESRVYKDIFDSQMGKERLSYE